MWRPVAEAYSTGLSEAVADTAARLRTSEARVAASIVQFSHAARLWSPVLATAILHQVVPDLADLECRWSAPVSLRLRCARGWQVTDPGRLADLVYRVVVTEHLEPLAAGLRAKVAGGLLWGNAASALLGAVHVLIESRPDVHDLAVTIADRLLATGRLRDTGYICGPGLRFQRRSCCLYYRVPGGGKCADCSILVRK